MLYSLLVHLVLLYQLKQKRSRSAGLADVNIILPLDFSDVGRRACLTVTRFQCHGGSSVIRRLKRLQCRGVRSLAGQTPL